MRQSMFWEWSMSAGCRGAGAVGKSDELMSGRNGWTVSAGEEDSSPPR